MNVHRPTTPRQRRRSVSERCRGLNDEVYAFEGEDDVLEAAVEALDDENFGDGKVLHGQSGRYRGGKVRAHMQSELM